MIAKLLDLKTIVFCIIPIQFFGGQVSSILPNKHTYSGSPKNSHLVQINQVEGNKMWRVINQCGPKRSRIRRSWEVVLLVSPSIGAQKARGMTAGHIVIAQFPSLSLKILTYIHFFSGSAIFLLFRLLKCNTTLFFFF